MTSREEILARIRTANRAQEPDDRKNTAMRRIGDHPVGIVPQGPTSVAARRNLFVAKAKAAAATVDVIRPGEESDAIRNWLRSQNLAPHLRMGNDRRLKRIKWPRKGGVERTEAVGDGESFTALGHAIAGIAESGTLVMASGPQNPTTLNFLAENHIVVLDEKNIANDHETAWSRIRRRYGARNLPRAINMITGPSRSADIEQTLILGAHGPIRLHILVVREK